MEACGVIGEGIEYENGLAGCLQQKFPQDIMALGPGAQGTENDRAGKEECLH